MMLTVPEIAKQIRVSKMTIYRLIYAGKLQATLAGAGDERATYRVAEEDWVAFLDNSWVTGMEDRRERNWTCYQ